MNYINVVLTSILSAFALFIIAKLIGHKQISQLDFFDYIAGITIGSIAAELATELEKPLQPLIAMIVYGVVTIALSVCARDFPKTRKYINGTPTILMDNGKLYRENLKKAKLDLSEFMVMCRELGYFDLTAIQTAIFEYNGKLTIKSQANNPAPLKFIDVQESDSVIKNTCPGEVDQIIDYVRRNPNQKIGIITPFANQRTLITDELKRENLHGVSCGTVHAFQGDEKDVILFSLGISDSTRSQTYEWLKNNRELINVATSRARDELVVFGSAANLRRLHAACDDDDLYELVEYIRTNGESKVSERTAASRALGIKPYSTETEAAFMENLNHAIDVLQPSGQRYVVHKEVPVSQVFTENTSYADLFYTGRFDFVVYERSSRMEYPVLAIELDGKEHLENEAVRERDRKKNQICKDHNFELIRVENTYARRYHYIKDILIKYFAS